MLAGEPGDPVLRELQPHAPDLASREGLGRGHQDALGPLDVDRPDRPGGQLDLAVPGAARSRVVVDERLRGVAVAQMEVRPPQLESEARPSRVRHLDLAVLECLRHAPLVRREGRVVDPERRVVELRQAPEEAGVHRHVHDPVEVDRPPRPGLDDLLGLPHVVRPARREPDVDVGLGEERRDRPVLHRPRGRILPAPELLPDPLEARRMEHVDRHLHRPRPVDLDPHGLGELGKVRGIGVDQHALARCHPERVVDDQLRDARPVRPVVVRNPHGAGRPYVMVGRSEG